MRAKIATIVFVLAGVLAAPAFAKHVKRTLPPPPEEAIRSGYCQPLCTQDVSPCDPPEFKRADGRCDNGAYGGAGGGFH